MSLTEFYQIGGGEGYTKLAKIEAKIKTKQPIQGKEVKKNEQAYKVLVVAMVAVLSLSAIGGVALAQTSEDASAEQAVTQNAFVEKLAERLDIDVEEPETALAEVRQKMREEALQERVDKAVQAGVLTEDEAGDIAEWWQERPGALEGFGPSDVAKRHMRHGSAGDFGGPCGARSRGF